jgi:hypothetical protein
MKVFMPGEIITNIEDGEIIQNEQNQWINYLGEPPTENR